MADGQGTTHHIRLGDYYYLIKPGTYRKTQAPMFGPRFTTGDPDWNNLSLWQHWAQRCWIGGVDAPEWEDDAMFDKSIGIDTTNHEVLLLARDLGPSNATRTGAANYNLATEAGTSHKREFFTWSGSSDTEKLYCLSYDSAPGSADSLLFRWTGSAWTLVNTFTRDCRSVARFRSAVIFGTSSGNLRRMTGSPGSESFSDVAKPSGVTDTPYVMKAWRGQLWVGFGQDIWRLKRDLTWDGSTAFYEGSDITRYTGMELHLGFLYICSNNGHIFRSDGNNTFDMWSMESGTQIQSMRSFDGRLFIACRDPLEGTTAAEAVLYQFTGAAVTELKRFGKVGVEMSFGKLRTVGGRMFMGASSLWGFQDGFGIGMYDPVEDSYHMFATNRLAATYTGGTEQVKWIVDDVVLFNEYLWVTVRGYGVFRTRYTVRDVERFLSTYDNSAVGGTAPNGGWLESSEFDAGTPGMLKLWNAIILDIDVPSTATSIGVDYSVDNGANWVAAGSHTGDGTTKRLIKTFPLGSSSTGGVYSASLKYRLRLHTTDSSRTPAIRGLVVRYLPVPEPNWVWNFDIVLSDEQILLDGTVQNPDNATKLAALETAFRAQNLLHFVDIDGTKWASGTGTQVGVLIQSMQHIVTHIGPTSEGSLERDIRIQLIETVEAYAS